MAGPNKREAFLTRLKLYQDKKRPKAELESSRLVALTASDESSQDESAEAVLVPESLPAESEDR